MARAGGKKPASETPPPAAAPPAPIPEVFDPAALAEGILARTIRPRAADIRRLAEAMLAAARRPDKKKKSKKKAAKKAAKKAERKLSKIPGQKDAK